MKSRGERIMDRITKGRSLSKEQWLLLAGLLLLSVAVYLNSIYGEFVLDDEVLIQENMAIHSLWSVHLVTYRLVRTFSYAVDYFFWGENPLGYHLSNIFYNTLTVLLVFLLTRKLTGTFLGSFTAALIFAVHPIHTEAVSYLSGRRDILSTLFYLAGFYTYLRARDERKGWMYPVVAVFYLAGISSKEMAVTLPLLIFAYEVLQTMQQMESSERSAFTLFFRAFRDNLKRFRVALILVVVLTGFYLYLILFVQQASGRITSGHIRWWGGTPVSNFATMARVLSAYLQMLFFPITLRVSYIQFPYAYSFLQSDVLLSCTGLLALVGVSFLFLRRNWKVTFLIWFFFITLLPVMQILPHHVLIAEHYLYLPSYSFCLAAGLAVDFLSRRKNLRKAAVIVLVPVTGLFFARTVDRNSDWIDAITLTTRDLKQDPENPVLHFFRARAYTARHLNLSASRELEKSVSDRYHHAFIPATRAVLAYETGDYEKGERETQEALQLDPENRMALLNRGMFALMMGDKDKALESYTRAGPDFEASSHILNLSAIYREKGNSEEAETLLSKALARHPERPELHYGLAETFIRSLEFRRAEEEYNDVLRLAGGGPGFKIYREEIPEKIRWVKRLEKQYGEAVKRLAQDPQDTDGHYLLAQVYRHIGAYEKAEKELRKAVAVEHPRVAHESLLAEVLVRNGKRSEAGQLFERLLKGPAPDTDLIIAAGDYFTQALDFRRASDLFREALKRRPGDRHLAARLSGLQKLSSLWKEAEVLGARGRKSASREKRGDAYSALGMNRKATEEYESALTDQNNPSVEERLLLKLLDLYAAAGYRSRAKAIALCRRVLDMDPGNAGVALRLAKIYYTDVADYESAFVYFQEALSLDLEGTEKESVSRTVETLARYLHEYLPELPTPDGPQAHE